MKKLDPDRSYARMKRIADSIEVSISKHVKRLLLVGSLGRREGYAEDIDILVEPVSTNSIEGIRAVLKDIGEWKKGADRQMTVKNVFHSGVQLDLFLCHPPAQWGVLTAVRLNPIPLVIYGKQVIDDKGYIRGGGTIHDEHGDELHLPTEREWFDLIDIPFSFPEKRWELVRDLRLI